MSVQVVIKNTLVHDFGADGDGSIKSNGTVMTLYKEGGPNQQFTSGGKDIITTTTNNGYVGRLADGTVIYTLNINSKTGEYTYKQYEPVDHPGAGLTGTKDVIWVKFGVTITDGDGDTDTAFIQIDIRDDAPDAKNDSKTITEGNRTTGNVITNDDVGADEAGTVMKVTFAGRDYNVPTSGNLTVTGDHGTLTINKAGSYTYVAGQVTRNEVDQFTYTLKDADGDTDTATLTINVGDVYVPPDFTPTGVGGSGSTDDTVVDNSGRDVETGTISVNYHGDGPGTTMGTGSFSSPGLRSGGSAVNVSFNNGTYTGTAGGKVIFTMTINSNGTYRFEQKEALDHSNTNSNNEGLNLVFGVKATDSDGDVGSLLMMILERMKVTQL